MGSYIKKHLSDMLITILLAIIVLSAVFSKQSSFAETSMRVFGSAAGIAFFLALIAAVIHITEKWKQSNYFAIVLFFVFLSLLVCCLWTYNLPDVDERKEIREQAYEEGYDSGFDDGRIDAGDDYEEGYETGYEDGKYDTQDDSYHEGLIDGSRQGYEHGYDDAVQGYERDAEAWDP